LSYAPCLISTNVCTMIGDGSAPSAVQTGILEMITLWPCVNVRTVQSRRAKAARSRRSGVLGIAPVPNTLRLALVACLSMALTHGAGAQLTPFYTIGADGVSLNDADFTMLVDAANGLLRRPRLANGATASWQNAQSGSHGTISVTKTFHRESMLCHTLSYETVPMATTSQASTTILNWCKTGDGSWRILTL
jgi:surface antigen